MDHANSVRGLESAEDLQHDGLDLRPRHRSIASDSGGEIFPLKMLHDQEGHTIFSATEVGHCDDIGMTDERRDSRFAEKEVGYPAARSDFESRHFDCEVSVEINMLGEVDESHAAGADFRYDVIALSEDRTEKVGVRVITPLQGRGRTSRGEYSLGALQYLY